MEVGRVEVGEGRDWEEVEVRRVEVGEVEVGEEMG